MTTEPKTNFLGIPIDGDINRPRPGKNQRPREEFEPIVAAVLADPFFVEFGWTQRTPYFNDGDPCVFSAFAPWVRTEADSASASEDEDYDEDDTDQFAIHYSTHPMLGGEEGWGDSRHYVGDREAQWRVANAFGTAIEGGEFDHVLVELFGDHCTVKIARSGISVDEYSHE